MVRVETRDSSGRRREVIKKGERWRGLGFGKAPLVRNDRNVTGGTVEEWRAGWEEKTNGKKIKKDFIVQMYN